MSIAELPVVAAMGLGLLTSISPCPMASQAAASSVLVREADGWKRGLAVGFAYALGRAATYAMVAWIVAQGFLRIGPIVRSIQAHAEPVIGVVFLAGGLILAASPWLKLSGIGIDATRWKSRADRLGAIPGAFFLGGLLAMAFCPVSAGIYFGSVIPLSMATTPSWSVTTAYGLATAIPVVLLVMAAGCGTRWIARMFHASQKVAPWLHWFSVAGMIGSGIWLLAKSM